MSQANGSATSENSNSPFDFSSAEIMEVFACSPNLNAALKNFLKKEVRKGDAAERFIKQFRKVAQTRSETALKAFFDKHLPAYAQHFLLLAGYSNAESVNQIAEEIINKHADAFNATYETGEDEITITDQKTFESITKEVNAMITSGISRCELPQTNFMKLVLVNSIFEDPVTEKITPILFPQ